MSFQWCKLGEKQFKYLIIQMNRTILEFIVSFQSCKLGKKTIQVSNHPMNRITLEFILIKNPIGRPTLATHYNL
jgi:hypothetical protein